ncbi:MAG: RNA 2',3'-cyclic phosphodiesterase [Candidatus Palauibacterales bacterium]|nr:RNA 2',3'-cyclic phosphodiesterase [Candidatus Palauibacterales bacterium]MDP2530754.1 RNA 2',3'-cyclic phosphodiesterase [Candidatus Palauibacterales bacterium]MDP2582726.1 RNA 2',3'-cyclic phosphodiesterase [Candidatus Palauibacterales bacterium]
MRLFIAINPPAAVRQLIHDGTASIRESGLPARWVDTDHLHLTLKFLGEVREQRLQAVKDALLEAAAGCPPFELRLEGVGAFPSLRRPRVIWLGVEATLPLRALKHDVEHAFARLGIDRASRAFHPHLTLGRARDQAQAGEFRELERLAARVEVRGGFEVQSVDLMRSRLGPGGTRYSVEASARFEADE